MTSNSIEPSYRAVIADDEPLLLQALATELNSIWPELEIVGSAGTGSQATKLVFEQRPDIVFLDITMPDGTGLEAAQAIAEDWPENDAPPLVVFVTAHDEYAIQAFNTAAADYVLKPVNQERLGITVARLKQRLTSTQDVNALSDQMLQLLNKVNTNPAQKPEYLRTIRASIGDSVHMIPIAEVVLLESADKYVIVHTANSLEALIREPLRTLITQLNPDHFAQISRGAIVNLNQVKAATRSENGKLQLDLIGCERMPNVSRIYRHLFQAM